MNFDDEGSIRLSSIEQEAYRSIVTLEVNDVQGFRYKNFKHVPPSSFFGYCTIFEGSSVTKTVPVNYYRQRISDTRNLALWNRYAFEEVAQLVIGSSEATANAVIQELSEATPDLLEFVIQLFDPTSAAGEAFYGWLLSLVSDPSTVPDAQEYLPPPVDTPHPTVLKFQSDLPARFSFLLDSWYLVNPASFIVGGVVDSSESTDGGNEYFDGGSPDGGSYGDGNEDDLDPGSDPRDNGNPNGVWFPGAQIAAILGAKPVRSCEIQDEETFTLTIPNSQSDLNNVEGLELFDFEGGCPDFNRKGETYERFTLKFADNSGLDFEFPFARGNVDARIVSIQYS